MNGKELTLLIGGIALVLIAGCSYLGPDDGASLEEGKDVDTEETCDNKFDYLDRFWCFKDLAIKMKEPRFCESIVDSRISDQCYTGAIESTSNKSICDSASNSYAKEKCLGYYCRKKGNDPPDHTGDNCLAGIAQEEGSKTLCDKIEVDEIKDRCHETLKGAS